MDKTVKQTQSMWQTILPKDVVYAILLFDPRFKLRNGELVSIIPKDDERYSIIHTTTRTRYYIHYTCEWVHPTWFRLQYASPDRHRHPLQDQSDTIDVEMKEINNTLVYNVVIFKLKKYNDAEFYWKTLKYCFQRE